MFYIKVLTQEVLKEIDENGHRVKEILNTISQNYATHDYTMFPTKPDGCEQMHKVSDRLYDIRSNFKISEMNLCVKFKHGSGGWDQTISIPVDCPDTVTEIYIMNENGKTLERFIY
jgi:hypothetical protein